MPYVLTIAGVSKILNEDSLDIVRSVNSRARLTCEVLSGDGSYRPPDGAEIIYTQDGTRLFGGHVSEPTEAGLAGEGLQPIVTRIQAIDFNALIDRRVLNLSIPAGTLKQALQALDDYLAPYGVTLDPAQVDGPSLPALSFPFQGLKDALDQLSTLTGYVYEVDEFKLFRMFLPSSTPAPFNVVDGDGHAIGDITVEPSRAEYFNRVLVLAGSGIRDVTDTFTGDGTTKTWTLRYSLIARPASLTVGGVTKPLGVYGVDVNMEWTYDAPSNALSHHASYPAPGVGVSIVITYTAQFPVLATADDFPEQAAEGPSERIYEAADVFDVAVAQAIADAYLARDVARPRRVKYMTLTPGLRPGQTQTITIAWRNLNATFLIEEVKIAQRGFDSLAYYVTAVEGTSPAVSWRDVYQEWSGGKGNASVSGVPAVIQLSGGTAGTGTSGRLAKWNSSDTLGDSLLTESGSTVTVAGTLAAAALQGSLAASYLTGTIDDARLSVNVPLKNAGSNAFSGSITIGGTLGVTGVATFSTHVNPATNYTSNLGSLSTKYLTLHAAELWVETLVAQNTLATIGGRVLVAPTTLLTADLAPAGTTITVKHNSLANGDRIYLEANGQVEWIAVTSGAGGSAGAYTYSVTRDLDGSGANQWYAGDAVLNTGTTGDGFIDLYSVSGVLSGAGPTIVGNVRTGTTYSQIAPRWAIGNLNGLYGYASDLYGAAFGDPSNANLTIDATNGLRIRQGTTVYAQMASSTFRVGAAGGNRVEWNGSALTVVSANLTIDSSGVALALPAAYADANSYRFTPTSPISGACGLYAHQPNSTFRYLRLQNYEDPGAQGYIEILQRAHNGIATSKAAQIILYTNAVSPVLSYIRLDADTVRFPDGLAGAPSMTFWTDPTTGFFMPAAGFIGVSINGTNLVRWDNNGDLHPLTDNTQRVGLATHRFTLIRGVTVTSGDLEFENGWSFTESYKVGIAEPGVALVDEAGALVAFFGRTRCYAKPWADVDDLPYHVTSVAGRAEMDLTPERRAKETRRDGSVIFKTAADVAPLPSPSTARSNRQRGA